jgi:hypothetical protein
MRGTLFKLLCVLIFIFFVFIKHSFPQEDSLSRKNFLEEDDEFTSHQNKIIDEIIIIPIDVAGKSINNGNGQEPGWFGRLSNSLHYRTREWVIRNRLLFSEGDTVVPMNISESERILRVTGYFLDAKIKIQEKDFNTDSVDIIVTTKDRWTLTPQLSYNTDDKYGYFGFRDDNFLGLGHKFETIITHDQRKSVGWGGIIQYLASNVAGTFIDAGVFYESNNSNDLKELSFSKPFVTTETEWAAGLDFSWANGNLEFSNNGMDQVIHYSRNIQDLWVGRSYPIWFGDQVFKRKTRLISSARVQRKIHNRRPEVTPVSNRLFENSTLFLLNLGLINRRFYKDYFIDHFGITEDIPIGGILSFTFGIEDREFSERWYASSEFIYSRRIESIGYLSATLSLSGFRNINRWEQNLFDMNIIYHTPLISFDGWKYRIFFENDFMYGFNRFIGEQIHLDIKNHMRGIDELTLYGTKRAAVNLEARIFSPFTPLGFYLGAVIFADFGTITPRDTEIWKSRLYQSYGFGFRTRNESIARTDFEIALVYNPYNPVKNGSSFKILFTSSIVLGIRNIGFHRPSVMSFGSIN